MFETAKQLIDECKKNNKTIAEVVIDYQLSIDETTVEDIYNQLYEILKIMDESANHFTKEASKTRLGMIDGFGYSMMNYSSTNTLSGEFITKAIAMAFSTLEMSATMHKIVAAPTAGASGILPAAIISYHQKYGVDKKRLADALLVGVGIGEFIAKYANFAGAQGGCQAECGSASAMAAAALVFLHGGSVEQCLHAASFSIIHVLGLICDPIAGLVEYPCSFRNGSGVVNAIISADMALAGVTSIVPFEEVVKTMDRVGKEIPHTSRETGLGGIAICDTACKYRDKYLSIINK